MGVLIAQADQPLVGEHFPQPQMDSRTPHLALTGRAAALRLAELPDAFALRRPGCDINTTFSADAQTK